MKAETSFRMQITVASPHLILRPMTLHDVAAASDLDRLVFDDPWPAEAFAEELLLTPESYYFVIEHLQPHTLASYERLREWSLLGLVGMRVERMEDGRERGHITNLAVVPAWQGRGLGRRLLEQVLITARYRRLNHLILEVYTTNRRAIALYERAGFVITDYLPRYYKSGADAYTMLKRLPDGGPTAPLIGRVQRPAKAGQL